MESKYDLSLKKQPLINSNLFDYSNNYLRRAKNGPVKTTAKN